MRPGRLIAFRRDDLGVAGPSWRDDEHEVARWCRLLTESGVAADQDALDLQVPDRPPPVRSATVVHPARPLRPGAGLLTGSRPWRVPSPPAGTTSWSPARRPSGLSQQLVAETAGLCPERVLAGRLDLARWPPWWPRPGWSSAATPASRTWRRPTACRPCCSSGRCRPRCGGRRRGGRSTVSCGTPTEPCADAGADGSPCAAGDRRGGGARRGRRPGPRRAQAAAARLTNHSAVRGQSLLPRHLRLPAQQLPAPAWCPGGARRVVDRPVDELDRGLEPVSVDDAWASSSTIISSGLPMFTGPAMLAGGEGEDPGDRSST